MKLTAAEKRYFAYVDSLPCCHCKTTQGITHHHLIGIDKMGIMGGKVPNFVVVPLCGECHYQLHNDGGTGWPQTRWLVETLSRAFADGVIEYGDHTGA